MCFQLLSESEDCTIPDLDVVLQLLRCCHFCQWLLEVILKGSLQRLVMNHV